MDILLVEDEDESRIIIRDFLKEHGFNVIDCPDGKEAFDHFKSSSFDLVLTDLKLPGISGLELLRKISAYKAQRDYDVVIFTGHGDMNSAIEALRLGAQDYLLKPINIEELIAITNRVAQKRALETEALKPAGGLSAGFKAEKEPHCKREDILNIISTIPGMGDIGVFSESTKQLLAQALKFHEDRDIPVLIQGETGTGKEMVARIIHYGESAADTPFVDINCAAINSNLFESELFGHDAGAFTGALNKGSLGKLDLASGGTLFLDEIGELSLELQAKLLRVIQEREFYRVGGLKKVKIDVRIICATNVDLSERVKQGLFRADLFYRLNVGSLYLPGLRERKEAIIPLVHLFLTTFSSRKGKNFSKISKEAKELLLSYDWPGNIRELRNVIELAVFNNDDVELRVSHLDILNNGQKAVVPGGNSQYDSVDLAMSLGGLSLEEYTDEIILKALHMNNGNKTKAADYLGISRRSLYCHLERIKRKRKANQHL